MQLLWKFQTVIVDNKETVKNKSGYILSIVNISAYIQFLYMTYVHDILRDHSGNERRDEREGSRSSTNCKS